VFGLRIDVDPRAAMLAGLAAALVSTVVELLAWRAFGFALPETLLRDARLAAAIVLGRDVLPPPAAFDGYVIGVASCVHGVLSIAYAFVLAVGIARLSARTAIAAGALFGAALYAINMYGFTWVFPWFAVTRDAITAIAHVAFGITASATYVATRRHATA
jgi:hypothetical protein